MNERPRVAVPDGSAPSLTAWLRVVLWGAFILAAEVQAGMARQAQAERAALETQKLQALSQLTGGVAHDFNNLLTILSNNLHILTRSRSRRSSANCGRCSR